MYMYSQGQDIQEYHIWSNLGSEIEIPRLLSWSHEPYLVFIANMNLNTTFITDTLVSPSISKLGRACNISISWVSGGRLPRLKKRVAPRASYKVDHNFDLLHSVLQQNSVVCRQILLVIWPQRWHVVLSLRAKYRQMAF